MTSDRILIVDDETENAVLLGKYLHTHNMESTVCFNGKEALEEFRKEQYPIVITDVNMPVMNGIDLLKNIKAIDEDTVIIILSGYSDSSVIIESMKLGAFDYIVKPVIFDDIYSKLQLISKSETLRKTGKIIQKEKQSRLENQLEWYRWQERFLSRKFEMNDESLFAGLRRSFTQGMGFGTLLTMLDVIFSNTADKNDGKLFLDKDVISIINENVAQAKKGLKVFSEIEFVEKNEVEMKEISVHDIYSKVDSVIKSLEKFALIKNNVFLQSRIKKNFSHKYLYINEDYLFKAVFEILLNSIKFSQSSSPITVIIDIAEDRFILDVLNLPEKNSNGIVGIPEEYENRVFEPFFRITKSVYEDYNSLDYGIGLTMCEKIIIKHGGSIRLFNVRDYSDIKTGVQTKVCCEIQLPLKD